MDRSLSQREGGLNAFKWNHIFALDSAVVEIKEMFSLHGGVLTNAMYHHGLIKLTHHDETMKRAHDSQIVRANENHKLSHGGPATDNHQAPTQRLKLFVRAVIESEA